ncbi:hypothetical protein GCM10011579_093700 [Streptomyces albiflavescens]|uniref:Uncharacterized protein n=1 Tax=Streptomyces albiflavescens TaxID=1623582 RepID=A0A917YFF9_9ACTN|nr:hypothetical protein [Streptomyces albiflavescens]GGN94330.1 hypothetical protein GCM10011579_093700 [Streptomyces albiflavescens]
MVALVVWVPVVVATPQLRGGSGLRDSWGPRPQGNRPLVRERETYTSNAAYLEDLAAFVVAEGRTEAEGRVLARWVIASERMTFGFYDSAYAGWVQSLTCTMTVRNVVLTCSHAQGTREVVRRKHRQHRPGVGGGVLTAGDQQAVSADEIAPREPRRVQRHRGRGLDPGTK